MIRKLFARTMLAALLVLAGSAAAQAAFYQFLTIESSGGFVRSSDKTMFWAEVNGGRIARGFVLVQRDFKGMTPAKVNMTGTLTARQTYDLWMTAYQAKPWAKSEVVATFVNTDFPDTIVTYMGRYTQTIRASFVTAPANLDVVSSEMQALTSKAWDHSKTVTHQDLFVQDERGGRAGYERTIRISQSGEISDDVGYLASGVWPRYSKQGNLTPAELNELKRLVFAADWFNLTDFAGNPNIVDAIAITTTYSRWGTDKAIEAGFQSNRTLRYQEVIDKAQALADQLP